MTLKTFIKKHGLKMPDPKHEWAQCEKCNKKLLPLKPYISKFSVGLENTGKCDNCGFQNDNSTSISLPRTAKQRKEWLDTLSEARKFIKANGGTYERESN